jgi:hypothetical protein
MLLTPETLFLENEMLEHGVMLPGSRDDDMALDSTEAPLGIPELEESEALPETETQAELIEGGSHA